MNNQIQITDGDQTVTHKLKHHLVPDATFKGKINEVDLSEPGREEHNLLNMKTKQ